tara:strand:+ start:500 stop:643 length:144 start_codon:yes stop_codon:yes gene_type:complete
VVNNEVMRTKELIDLSPEILINKKEAEKYIDKLLKEKNKKYLFKFLF